MYRSALALVRLSRRRSRVVRTLWRLSVLAGLLAGVGIAAPAIFASAQAGPVVTGAPAATKPPMQGDGGQAHAAVKPGTAPRHDMSATAALPPAGLWSRWPARWARTGPSGSLLWPQARTTVPTWRTSSSIRTGAAVVSPVTWSGRSSRPPAMPVVGACGSPATRMHWLSTSPSDSSRPIRSPPRWGRVCALNLSQT